MTIADRIRVLCGLIEWDDARNDPADNRTLDQLADDLDEIADELEDRAFVCHDSPTWRQASRIGKVAYEASDMDDDDEQQTTAEAE